MRRVIPVCTLAILPLWCACERPSSPSRGKGRTDQVTAPAPVGSGTSAGSTVAPNGSVVVAHDAPSDAAAVPAIPSDRSSPPTVADWRDATEVNTQTPGARPEACYLKIVREWLKIHCDGKVIGVEDLEGFGQESWDYYQSVRPGHAADLVARLRKGHSMKLTILREDQNAVLFVSWPPTEPKPLHVALGIGGR